MAAAINAPSLMTASKDRPHDPPDAADRTFGSTNWGACAARDRVRERLSDGTCHMAKGQAVSNIMSPRSALMIV
jgi:hypothetical protein